MAYVNVLCVHVVFAHRLEFRFNACFIRDIQRVYMRLMEMVRAQLHTSLMHFCINGFCFSTSIAARDIYHGNPIQRITYTIQTPLSSTPPPIELHHEMMRRKLSSFIAHPDPFTRASNRYFRMYQAKEIFHCSFDLCLDNNIVMIIVVGLLHSNKMKIPRLNIVNHSTIGWVICE